MINLQVKIEKLKKDYPDFYNFFKNTLKNSQSSYKNYEEDKYKCYYYIGFYMKPSQKTEKYYNELYNLKWDERIKKEYEKIRITITMVAGKFAISDQTKEISDTVKPIIDEIVSRKMIFEQKKIQNEEVYNSIPNVKELEEKIQKEIEAQKDFLEAIGIETETNIERSENLSPQDRLNKLIENENYEEANDLIKQHPELKRPNN